jgi:simple sugar transport system substrate-binding protein
MNTSYPALKPAWRRRLTSIGKALPVLVVAVALAACSSQNGASSSGGSSTSGNNAGGGSGVTIAVMGGAASDPFWSTVKNGGQAAAKAVEAAGGKVTFVAMPNYNNFNSDAAKLVSNILALKPSAAVIPDWAPDAQNANIKALVAAGIPVIIYNTGEDQVKTVGATSYVGSDNTASGKLAGQQLAAAGSKHVVCINTLPGQQTGQQYCDGLKEGATTSGAKESELDLPSSQFGDPTSVAQAIKGALIKDPSIDGVFTVDAGDATSAANAISQANLTGKVRIASQNFDADGLARIKNGTETVAIDQQGYAQGYYAVSTAFQYVAYGISLGNIATGPTAITKANIAVVEKGQKLGVR